MLENVGKRFLALALALMMVFSILPASVLTAQAATVDLGIPGLGAKTEEDETWDNGEFSVTGSDKMGCIEASAGSDTLTLTNQREDPAQLSFDYSVFVNGGTIEIDGQGVQADGSFTKLLDPGASVAVKITSAVGANKTTITLKNISLISQKEITVTVKPAQGDGSYTVNGNAVTEEKSFTQQSTEPIYLVATPGEGQALQGWYNETDGMFVSSALQYTFYTEEDAVIYPVFIDQEIPVFKVGNQQYLDLKEANKAASEGEVHRIVMVKSGKLPSGEYEISAGNELLIPYNDTYSDSFSGTPKYTNRKISPSVYSSLQVMDGAVIKCYGDLNVNAQQFSDSQNETGSVSGPYGSIELASGATLSMENGSNLYCFGYIGGTGLVHMKDGSNVYENFQIEDWRGGSASTGLNNKKEFNSFLISQYYFQNVESKLRIDKGSKIYSIASVTAGGVTNQSSNVVVGESDGVFQITSGYAMMHYQPDTDRVELDLYGNMTTDEIAMSVSGMNMNTGSYILGLPMNYTINIHSGSNVTFAQKFKLMPGTVVNIEEGAVATVEEDGAVYIYDHDDWNSDNFTRYAHIYQLTYVHARRGVPVSRDTSKDAVLNVDGTLIANGPVYSTKKVAAGGDAGITGNGTYISTVYGDVTLKEATQDGTETTIVDIACVPAVGPLAGNEGLKSFALGTYQSDGDDWYEYTLDGEGITLLSGAKAGTDVVGYIANVKDVPAVVDFDAGVPCVSLSEDSEATLTKLAEPEGRYRLTEIASDITVIPYSGHTEEILPSKEATCSETGLTEGKKCSVCGTILVEQETIEKTAHTPVIDAAVAATCTATGLTEGSHCSVCNEVIVAQQEVAKLAHTINEDNKGVITTEPGCETEGVRTFYCDKCGNVAETETIPANGHSYGEWVTETEPTCTETGLKKKTCSACDDEQTMAIDALGHLWDEGAVTKEPTCGEEGVKTFTCTREGCDAIKEESIGATGEHTWELTEILAAPDCTEDGNGQYTCSVCDATKQEVLNATGHTPEIDEAVEPTCTETGLTEGSHCSVCNAVIVEQQTIPATGHNYVTSVVAPNCTDQGYTLHTCSVCGDFYKDDFTETNDDHDYKDTVTAPTCTADGYTTHTCTRCGDTYKDAETKALGHDYKETVTDPTCTEKGYTTYTCTREGCGFVKVENYVDALGHDYTETVTAPTCTQKGYTTYTCTRCDSVKVENYVDALGHDVKEVKTAATCETDGKIEYICDRCDEHTKEDTILPALGHKYGEDGTGTVVVEPGCESEGREELQCLNGCGTTETRTLRPLGHDLKTVVDKAPTCTAEGVSHTECSRCDYYQENTVGMIPHEGEDIKGYAATCTKDGLSTGTKCAVCGEILIKQEVIPATGHVYKNELDEKCSVCGEERILSVDMYRLYNRNTGEHFYTGSVEERDDLVKVGWEYEGVAWKAPVTRGAPIYRLCNPNNDDHHYTGSSEERDTLVELGWRYEGVAWNDAGEKEGNIPVFRLYNPNAQFNDAGGCGSHHYTNSDIERDNLVKEGWEYEGIAWYGLPQK